MSDYFPFHICDIGGEPREGYSWYYRNYRTCQICGMQYQWDGMKWIPCAAPRKRRRSHVNAEELMTGESQAFTQYKWRPVRRFIRILRAGMNG